MHQLAAPLLLMPLAFLLSPAAPPAAAPPPAAAAPAAVAPAGDELSPLGFLLGAWTGTGSGGPGQGSGGFTFTSDLGQHVLVRRSHADYPAAAGRPAVAHDDLLVVYRDPGRGGLRAIYFDNEGHVIDYGVEVPDPGTVRFVSAAAPAVPRYRLTYTRDGADAVKIRFEIAPPGSPEAFRTYLEGAAARSAPGR